MRTDIFIFVAPSTKRCKAKVQISKFGPNAQDRLTNDDNKQDNLKFLKSGDLHGDFSGNWDIIKIIKKTTLVFHFCAKLPFKNENWKTGNVKEEVTFVTIKVKLLTPYSVQYLRLHIKIICRRFRIVTLFTF